MQILLPPQLLKNVASVCSATPTSKMKQEGMIFCIKIVKTTLLRTRQIQLVRGPLKCTQLQNIATSCAQVSKIPWIILIWRTS